MLRRALINKYEPVRRTVARHDEVALRNFKNYAASKHISEFKLRTRTPSNCDVRRLKPGHFLSFAGLMLFTLLLYARPAEFYPSPITASIALIVALATLAFYLPTQLSLEGNLTARPREI